jgi:hypothetical protein
MNAAARVAVFGVALTAVLLAATAVGRAVGPIERESGAEDHGEDAASRLGVEVLQAPAQRFRIVDADGRPVEDFDLLHLRRMHLIVVRRDLSGFKHLHPRLESGGIWYVPLALREPGTWTAFADFSTEGRRATVAFDLHAPGDFEPRPLPRPSTTAQAGPYRVELSAKGDELAFTVTRGTEPVAVDRYLGARGHLVVLRESDLEYLHAHAERDKLAFETEFPGPGAYRLFLQFRAGGVHTAEFRVVR